MPNLLNGFVELSLGSGGSEFFEHLGPSLKFFCNLGDLLNNSTFLVFDNAAVIRKRSDAQPVILSPTSFEEQLSIRTDQRNHPRGCRRPKGKRLAQFTTVPGRRIRLLFERHGVRFSIVFDSSDNDSPGSQTSTCLRQGK